MIGTLERILKHLAKKWKLDEGFTLRRFTALTRGRDMSGEYRLKAIPKDRARLFDPDSPAVLIVRIRDGKRKMVLFTKSYRDGAGVTRLAICRVAADAELVAWIEGRRPALPTSIMIGCSWIQPAPTLAEYEYAAPKELKRFRHADESRRRRDD